MTEHSTDPEDDMLAELLADELVELARRPGLLRLHALQMAGLIGAPGQVTQEEIAAAWGLSRRQLRRLYGRALIHARRNFADNPNPTQP